MSTFPVSVTVVSVTPGRPVEVNWAWPEFTAESMNGTCCTMSVLMMAW